MWHPKFPEMKAEVVVVTLLMFSSLGRFQDLSAPNREIEVAIVIAKSLILIRQVPGCAGSMRAPSCELWRSLANCGEPTTPYSREPP